MLPARCQAPGAGDFALVPQPCLSLHSNQAEAALLLARQHLELDNRIFKDMRAKQRLKAQEGLSRHGSGSSSNGHPANGHATPSPEGSLHGSRSGPDRSDGA